MTKYNVTKHTLYVVMLKIIIFPNTQRKGCTVIPLIKVSKTVKQPTMQEYKYQTLIIALYLSVNSSVDNYATTDQVQISNTYYLFNVMNCTVLLILYLLI